MDLLKEWQGVHRQAVQLCEVICTVTEMRSIERHAATLRAHCDRLDAAIHVGG